MQSYLNQWTSEIESRVIVFFFLHSSVVRDLIVCGAAITKTYLVASTQPLMAACPGHTPERQ